MEHWMEGRGGRASSFIIQLHYIKPGKPNTHLIKKLYFIFMCFLFSLISWDKVWIQTNSRIITHFMISHISPKNKFPNILRKISEGMIRNKTKWNLNLIYGKLLFQPNKQLRITFYSFCWQPFTSINFWGEEPELIF